MADPDLPRSASTPPDPVETADAALRRFLEAHPLSWNHLLEALPDGTALLDGRGVIHYVNGILTDMTGYTRDELIGRNVELLVPPRHRDAEIAARERHATDRNTRLIWSDQDLSVLRKDGTEMSVDFALSPLVEEGRSWSLAAIRDNSHHRDALRARADMELRFRVAFDKNMAPMTFTDLDDRIIAVNESFCEMIGFTREELVGRDSTPFTYPEDYGITEATHQRALSGEVDQERYVKRYLRKDGRVIDVEVSRSPARDESGRIVYFVISERDITEERALTAQLYHQALHDPLTGLANRALFQDRLVQAHARVARQGGWGAVLLIDLDDFKGVNDAHGHLVGDQLLTAIAHRLRQVTRESDTLSRYGGDEFLYLAEGLGEPEEAERLASRLLGVMTEPVALADSLIEVRATIGLVTFDSNSEVDAIIQNADSALHEAKRHARSHFVVFTPTMHQQAVARFALIQELRHALVVGQIAMHYQPIIDLTTSEVVGFEALMRWQHPERGWVPPGEFIPLAEQSDLIIELGAFALRHAIAEASSWTRTARAPRPFVSVNLSARQFHDPGLVPLVAEILQSHDLDPRHLILEITEGAALQDIVETLNVMDGLNHLGVGIALDDFGTGFSSLSYLAALSPRIIKIDQSFVQPIHPSARNDTLLEMIVMLGQKLNMTMLAEGVETEGQLRHLRQLGCELGQGYLFSPAVPIEMAAQMVGQLLKV